MNEVFNSLRKRIDVSYGESSEINAKLDFAKGVLEQEEITQKLIIKYVESVLQIAEGHLRCYVKISPSRCSGALSSVTLYYEERAQE